MATRASTRTLALAFAWIASACCAPPALRSTGAPRVTTVDDTFAAVVLAGRARGPYQRLRKLAAFGAILRHRALSGDVVRDPAAFLRRLLGRLTPGKRRAARALLAHWRPRYRQLARCAAGAASTLPGRAPGPRAIRLVVGYDIGAAAPPDVLLNVAHPRFAGRPRELCYYALHEAHHVGFMRVRPVPDVATLMRSRATARALIAYMTQLEGMAVHAAYAWRRRDGALRDDDDYRVYLDADLARRALVAYAEQLARLRGASAAAGVTIRRVLTAMSSGRRLWYRVGALVSRAIERELGRAALVRSIAQPRRFEAMTQRLLSSASHGLLRACYDGSR